MRTFVLLTSFCLSNSLFAGEFILNDMQDEMKVPEGKVWVISSVTPSDCSRVCTSDLYVNGGMSVGKGMSMYGTMEISFSNSTHSELRIYSGSVVHLGDTSPKIKVMEIDE